MALNAAVLFFLALPLFAQHYEGNLVTPRGEIAISFDIDGASATITIPSQGIHQYALTNVTIDATTFRADMPNSPGNPHFEGKVTAGAINGTLAQGGAIVPFSVQVKSAADALAGFDELATKALKQWDVPGAGIVIVSHRTVAYAKGLGLRDVKNNLPATADTLFQIGSCTKAFTTFTLGELVDEGKVDWDKPVTTYLPGFRMSDPAVTQMLTVRDIVSHRSGLPRHDLLWYNNQTLTRKELVERLQYLPLSAGLRAKYQYSNLMFLVAGYLIEQITGKTWEAAVRERVLTPLDMTHTVFSDAEAAKTADYAKPYRLDGETLTEIPFREVGNMGPVGEISSSANDMAKWVIAQLGGGPKLIAPATLRELHTPQIAVGMLPIELEFGPAAYAMGWQTDTYRGHLRVVHGGNIDGFSALVTLFPNDDGGVVILTNASGSGYPDAISLEVYDRLLGLKPANWNATRLAARAQRKALSKEAKTKKQSVRKLGTKPAHALAEYAGDYENRGYGIVHFDVADASLQATYNGITTPLEHWHYETFNGLKASDPTFEDMKFTFRTDEDGNVAEVSAPFEPAVAPIVFEKKPDAKMSDPAYLRTLAGDYLLGLGPVSVALHGSELVLTIPGQPAYRLVPSLDGWFNLKGLTGFRAKFSGNEMRLSQPDGVYVAVKK